MISKLGPTLALCAAFLAAVLIGAHTFKTRGRANDLISVTGLAKQDFESDLAVWTGRFVARDPDLKKAYDHLKKDTELVKTFIAQKGATDVETSWLAVVIEKEFIQKRMEDGSYVQDFKGYLLTQPVRVESLDLNKIEVLSREVASVIDSGVEFYSDAPQYFYTKLGELKIKMIAEGTQDGRLRAEKIAENAGGKIGSLRYSALGVFQINVPNSSTEASWQGAFDTSSRRKSASVTIRLQFGID